LISAGALKIPIAQFNYIALFKAFERVSFKRFLVCVRHVLYL
jgi:hypothetical protein